MNTWTSSTKWWNVWPPIHCQYLTKITKHIETLFKLCPVSWSNVQRQHQLSVQMSFHDYWSRMYCSAMTSYQDTFGWICGMRGWGVMQIFHRFHVIDRSLAPNVISDASRRSSVTLCFCFGRKSTQKIQLLFSRAIWHRFMRRFYF